MDLSNKPRMIDVSRWQGIINWAQVKSNVAGAIIKVGGSDVGFYMDGQAHRNVIEARANGVPFGVYFYLGGHYAPSEEVQHIVNTINQLGGLKAGEPLCLDWEERRAGHDEVGYLTGIVAGLAKHGFNSPLIYMNLNYVRTQNWKSLVDRNCGLWVAAWGDNDAVPEAHEVPGSDEWPFWVLWQYSSTTSVPGIRGRVDQNVLNGSIDQFKKYGTPGGVSFPGSPAAIPVPPAATAGMTEYVIQSGDTLSSIAARYKTTWQQLYAINRDRIANPNKIYTGKPIRVPDVNAAPAAPAPAAPVPPKFHTVENGENLSVIAAKYGLSSWRTIYDMNAALIGGNPSLIKPGQRLRIP